MERSRTENRSAFAQAIKRRDGAMREMLGMGSDPVGYAEGDDIQRTRIGLKACVTIRESLTARADKRPSR
jgi:hypothetical protein